MSNNFFKQKNIIIIGASYGIGEALCNNLSQLGANLFLVARSKNKIDNLAKSLTGENYSFKCDITDKKQVINLIQEIKNTWSKIDLIIFSAGIYEPMSLNNYSEEVALNILTVNFTSILYLLDFFITEAKAKKLKHIAMISSSAGYFGMPNSLAYGASKAALSNLTESLFYELKKYDTKIQLINPGFVKTRLTDKNDFFMPNIISQDQAAKIIIKGLKKQNFEISFPTKFITFMKILKFLPFILRSSLLRKLNTNK